MASVAKIKTYHFLPYKYGSELLLDIGRIETLKNYVLDSRLHQLSFYEILFIEEGTGTFTLDENKGLISPQTIIFTSPGQIRRWEIDEKLSGYALFAYFNETGQSISGQTVREFDCRAAV